MKGHTSLAATVSVCIVLSLATLAVYFRTFHYPFVNFDDDLYVYVNPVVRAGISVPGTVWAFTSLYMNWHPLTWLSHMLDVQLFGLKAGPEHEVNVLLHIASVVLLFLALARLTAKPFRAAIVAGIFALHPLHVESVAWISERKDVLSTFFEMLTLLLYVRYAEKRTASRYISMALAFACSVMAKPMAVTFPFVLLLLDYWPLERIECPPSLARLKPLLWEKAPLFAMSVAASVLTVIAQSTSGEMIALGEWPFPARLANAVVVCMKYIEKAIWPSDLAVLYPLERPSAVGVVFAILAMAAITMAAILWRRKRPYLLVGWLWYLGMLVPVAGLVQAGWQSMADRYTYLPLVGLSIALVWTIADFAARRFPLQIAAGASAIIALVFLAVTAARQTDYWQSNETLYEHTLAITRNNFVIENNLGAALGNEGRTFEAVTPLENAVAIHPHYAVAQANLGHELLKQRRLDQAFVHLTEALRLDPGLLQVEAELGVLWKMRGNYEEASHWYAKALEGLPPNARGQSDLCFVLEQTGRFDEAIAHCREALRIKPDLAEARVNLNTAIAAREKRKSP
jgi:Flp pilus assembly protein TadD